MSSDHAELCVGAVVVSDGRLLLVERGRGAGVGMWSIPGGRVELGETMEAAVRRELHEETGLEAISTRHLGHVERIGAGWHFLIHDFLVEVACEEGLRAGDDASDARWIALDELNDVQGIVPGLVEFLTVHGVLA